MVKKELAIAVLSLSTAAFGYRTIEHEVVNPPLVVCNKKSGSLLCSEPGKPENYLFRFSYHQYTKPKILMKEGRQEYEINGFYVDEDGPDAVCNVEGALENKLVCEYLKIARTQFMLDYSPLPEDVVIENKEIDGFYIDHNAEYQEMLEELEAMKILNEKRKRMRPEEENMLPNEEEKPAVAKNESVYSFESINKWGAKKYKELKNWWIR